MKKSFIINVPHNKHGYSFAVKTTADEDDVIDLAKAKDLFEDEDDANYANVEELDEEYDAVAFPEENRTDLDA